MLIKSAKELEVSKKAYGLAMTIFDLSKNFPPEERFAITDQIRRSSRSICSNLQEAWAKRRYPAHFVSKLTDADGEHNETGTWLDFACDCKYIDSQTHNHLINQNNAIGAMLGKMINNPDPFIRKK